MLRLRQLRCSFCRKNESEVSKLVAGPRVYICEECVAIASRIMDDSDPSAKSLEIKTSIWRKVIDWVRSLIHRDDAQLTHD